MRERLVAWAAYRAGKMPLPPGYELEYGADVLLLRGADGTTVAAFSASGVAPSEVTRIAEEDYRTNDKSSALCLGASPVASGGANHTVGYGAGYGRAPAPRRS
jgi:hypothetical protein